MKIGILTQPLHNNYGGLLQNYALQHVLKGMGHDVETIDWRTSNSLKKWVWRKKELFLSLLIKDKERPRYQLNRKEDAVISRNMNRFINQYISVCPQHANKLEDFRTIDDKYHYDVYIVGSDQVWRPRYNIGMMPALFLGFVDRLGVKRISYAASFGTSEWEFAPGLTEICAELAKKFDLITVREKSGVGLCREYLGVDATHVLDPTMLLNREDYEKVVLAEIETKSTGTLFHYLLDPSVEKEELIANIAYENDLKPFTVMPKCQTENRSKWDVKYRIEDCVFPSVTSWLRGFMDAEMIVVDSFHGTVFSIIFNKPFWVIGNRKRGNARFESLLGMFGLEDRMITTVDKIDWNRKIDWMRVNEIRQKERERCVRLLKKIL